MTNKSLIGSAGLLLFLFLNFLVFLGYSQTYTGASRFSGKKVSASAFDKPGGSSKPLTWWHWINGNVTKDGIRKDLEDMKRVGIGGVQLFDTHMYLPKGSVRYGSDSWHEHVQYAIRLCDSLGLEFYIVNSPGWSGSGGPWISLEQSMKQLVYSETGLSEIKPGKFMLSQPYSRAGFYEDIAVLAVPAGQEATEMNDWYRKTGMTKTPLQVAIAPGSQDANGLSKDSILDLTEFFNPLNNVLSWSPPPGQWTILRFGYTTTGKTIHPAQDEGTGYEVDKLDPEAVEFQFKQSLGRIIKDAGELTGKAFKGVVFDSFEGGYQNWTSKLPTLFLEENGYDLKTYLPAFTGRKITSTAVTEAFLWDFRRTITALIAKNYRGTMQKLAHKYNLQVFSETQGGPMAPAVGNAFVDVPMNEFWTDGIEKRKERIRQTTSIANILGRRVVAAESFTSKPEYGKWQNVPRNLKRIGDYAFAAGINRFIFHTYTHQPYDVFPGFTMGRYGTHFGRTNTWWKYADAWITYLTRSQYLLQQGKRVADICYLYPEDAIYEPFPGLPEMPAGFTVDICYPPYLKTMKVRNGSVVLPSETNYRLIVLPDYPLMKLETLQKISDLLKSGAVVLGNPPVAPPDLRGTLEEREQFARIRNQLWRGLDGKIKTEKQVGKGKLYRGISPAEALKDMGETPDVEFAGEHADSLLFAHRNAGEKDIYFISNQAGEPRYADTYFRNWGKLPEIWDAKTGKTGYVPVFDTIGSRTRLPLQLQAGESIFIVFSKPLPDEWIQNKRWSNTNTAKAEQVISAPWRLVMGRGRTDSLTLYMDELTLWNEHQDRKVKYYSGEGIYYNHFILEKRPDKNEKVLLDIGDVYDIAVIYINRKRVGIVWENPGVIDISAFIRKGENKIRINVINRWVNRLIGDESISTELRYQDSGSIFTRGKLLEFPQWLTDPESVRDDKRHTFTTWKHYNAESPLVPSGLKGPVRLLFYEKLR